MGMEYLVLAFVCKLAVEVAFFAAKACFKRYKATKKSDAQTSDQA